jgi:hypothetical protein
LFPEGFLLGILLGKEPRPPVSLNGADCTTDAKNLIIQDMLDGLVPVDENIKDGRQLLKDMCAHQPEFAYFPFDKECYKARIKGIQAAVKHLQCAAPYGTTCSAQARVVCPNQTHGPTGKPLWRGSEAAEKLAEDMANGLHLQMEPGELLRHDIVTNHVANIDSVSGLIKLKKPRSHMT